MTDKSVFINGKWHLGLGEEVRRHDPASGETTYIAKSADKSQVRLAVEAASNTFDSWSKLKREARIEYMEAYAKALEKRAALIAETISRDTGKPLWETKTEAQTMIGKIAISIRAYNERTGNFSKPMAFGNIALNHRAYGVMAVLGPFNFPGHLPNGHIVPALLAGNTIVFKPSELAPKVSLLMIDALQEAGLPPGVVNLIIGARDTGAALLESNGINGVLFTGSANTGTFIHKLFGGRPEVSLALEMGGNNPLIISEPCEINAAADMIIHSSFITTGQRCSCARRIILPAGKFGDEIIDALIEKTKKMRIGAWNDSDEPFIGPLINAQMAQNMKEFENNLVSMGGKGILKTEILDRGAAFVSPALIDMSSVQKNHDEELFAPLAQIFRFNNFDEAINIANDTRFGLSSGLICDDEALWERAQNELRAGLINWNRPTTGASGELPFGGPGLSGNGRPSAYYAADYCAFPIAQQCAPKALPLSAIGLG